MKKFAILISTTISLQAFAADYQTNKEETVRLSKQEIIKNNAQIENEVKKSIEDIVSPVSKYEIQQINYMSNTNAQVGTLYIFFIIQIYLKIRPFSS